MKKRNRMRDRVALPCVRNCHESMQVSAPGKCPETGAAAKNMHDKRGFFRKQNGCPALLPSLFFKVKKSRVNLRGLNFIVVESMVLLGRRVSGESNNDQ